MFHDYTLFDPVDVLNRVGEKSLAGIIAGLLAEHEPLLRAEADGSSVIVRERGGPGVFRVSIKAREDHPHG